MPQAHNSEALQLAFEAMTRTPVDIGATAAVNQTLWVVWSLIFVGGAVLILMALLGRQRKLSVRALASVVGAILVFAPAALGYAPWNVPARQADRLAQAGR